MSDWSSDVSSSDLGKPLKARTYIQYADTHKEASRDSTDREGFAGYTIPVGESRIQVRPDGITAADRFVEDVTVNAARSEERRVGKGWVRTWRPRWSQEPSQKTQKRATRPKPNKEVITK